MSTHPLAGVVEKLRNGDEHLRRLAAATKDYLENLSNAAIVPENDATDPTRGHLRLKVLRHPPLTLATIAGDVVHNLRSSLDYFVEELVKRNGGTPSHQHQFPICAKHEGFVDALARGRLYGLHKTAVAAIEGFQPYQVKPEAVSRHPLLHLHKLSNRDKHHMLAIAALRADFAWEFVGKGGRVFRSGRTTAPILDGEALAEIPIDFTIDGEKTQLQSKITIMVGFGDVAFSGFDVAGCLQSIREFIGHFILPALSLFFDPLPEDLRLKSHGLGSAPTPMETLVLARAKTPSAAP